MKELRLASKKLDSICEKIGLKMNYYWRFLRSAIVSSSPSSVPMLTRVALDGAIGKGSVGGCRSVTIAVVRPKDRRFQK